MGCGRRKRSHRGIPPLMSSAIMMSVSSVTRLGSDRRVMTTHRRRLDNNVEDDYTEHRHAM